MATIDPTQQYDIIHTLTFAEASGNCPIRLYRGSSSAITGTVYYRAGTSGDWTSLSVSGTSTTFPVTSTTMQVAHNWNKSGDHYMTPSFRDATNITSIAISQKSALTGTMGNYFMYSYAEGCSSLASLAVPDTSGLTSVGNGFMDYYAYGCSSLTSLAVPDTSGLTSVGDSFMVSYARDCSKLTSLTVPDTSGLTSVGNSFMGYYAYGCSSLTSLAVPDTSGLTSVGTLFMYSYAYGCSSLTELVLPAVGWFEDNNVNWNVPASRLGVLKGHVLNSDDLNSWKALTAEGKTLYINYIRDPELVYYEAPEYCEYVADLIRIIIQSQSYNADTTRRIAKEYSYQADTLRKVNKTYQYSADTLRKIVIIAADVYPADTVRQIIAEQEFITDAKRQIAKEYSYSADMVRKIVKEYEFIADTLRHIITPYTQLIINMSIQEREIKLGVEGMPLIGNTVRLKAEFKDFNGEHVSPENVNLRIYDGYKKQVGEDIPVLPSDVGKYQYDYVIPDVIGPLYFEFVGTIRELPILGRATIDKRWI